MLEVATDVVAALLSQDVGRDNAKALLVFAVSTGKSSGMIAGMGQKLLAGAASGDRGSADTVIRHIQRTNLHKAALGAYAVIHARLRPRGPGAPPGDLRAPRGSRTSHDGAGSGARGVDGSGQR